MDQDACTVAHTLAERECLPEEVLTPALLALKRRHGVTVAHLLKQGTLSRELMIPEILILADRNGFTVAHGGEGTLPRDLMIPEIPHLRGSVRLHRGAHTSDQCEKVRFP